MTILAVTVHKKTKSTATGIKLMSTSYDGTRIRTIVPGSLFANSKDASLLQPGIRIVSVNNIPCDGLCARGVAQLIKDVKGFVTILLDDEVSVVLVEDDGGLSNGTTTSSCAESTATATQGPIAYATAIPAAVPTTATSSAFPTEPVVAIPVVDTATGGEYYHQ